MSPCRLDLYWIPLGAGAKIVRTSGKIYETLAAFADRRPACSLYHSALIATVPEGTYCMEMTPIPARHEHTPTTDPPAYRARFVGHR